MPGPKENDKLTELQAAEAAKAIAALRHKLLDRSNRNRLLNFNHSPRSKGHVRLVDEIPNFLFSELDKDRDFGFKAIPEPEDDDGIPEDEQSDTFVTTLERAQSENKEYLDRTDKLARQFDSDETDDGYIRASAKLDRWLRNQVRDELGMREIEHEAPDIIAIAKENNIEPAYELPDIPKDKAKASHFDRFMQTLLFPADLERRLAAVYEAAVHSLNEKGVNTLYLTFGFLEWFESDDSDKPLFAPLILLPLEMEKRVEHGQIDFTIRANGEEPQMNITLAARLKEDFGLVLPELNEDEKPEAYYKRIATLVKGKERWRVRRYITLGHFAFARLVMYNDLDETKWSMFRKPSHHQVARRMFGGGEARTPGGFREVYNPDDAQHELAPTPLVVDADSSQFSAVVDVVQGNNLVIQGPPGTGKSQTITNIIAAALNKGQSVLFVAEKMAALNVVMSRLENAGLGTFCMELHSTKAKKNAVIEALQKRLEMHRPDYEGMAAKRATRDLKEAKEKLRIYLQILQMTLGDTGLKISQILWRAHSKPESQLPERLKAVAIKDIEKWGPLKVQRVHGYFTNLAESESRLGGPPATCAWSWLNNATLTPIDFPLVEQHVHAQYMNLGQIRSYLTRLTAPLGMSAPDRYTSCTELFDLLESLKVPSGTDDETAFEALSSPDTAKTAERYSELVATAAHIQSKLEQWFPVGYRPTSEDIETLSSVASFLSQSSPTKTLEAVQIYIDHCKTTADDLDSIKAVVSRAHRTLHLTGSSIDAEHIEQLLEFQELIRETKTDIWAERSPARLASDAAAAYETLLLRMQSLRQEAAKLSSRLKCDAQSIEGNLVQRHRENLAKRGLLGCFFSDFRAAKQFSAKLYPEGHKIAKADIISDLEALESFARQRDDFFWSPGFLAIFARSSKGFETDVEPARRTIEWAQRARRALGAMDGSHQMVSFLFECTASEIEKFVSPLSGHEELFTRMLDAQRLELDSINTAPDRLRGDAKEHERQLAITDRLGVPRSCSVSDLPAAIKQCELWISTSQQLAKVAEQVQAIFGSTDVADRISRVAALRLSLEKSNLAGKSVLLAPAGLQVLKQVKKDLHDGRELIVTYNEHAKALTLLGANRGFRWDTSSFDQIELYLGKAKEKRELLPHWCSWQRIKSAIEDETHEELLALVTGGVPAATIADHFTHVIHRAMARRAHEVHPDLRKYSGVSLSEAQERVRKIDAKLKDYARAEIIWNVYDAARNAPEGNGYGSVKTYTDMALVNHECTKKTRHVPLRDLLGRAGGAIQKLMPCFMMSPLSVAQFLKNDGLNFDIVIFDEASQVLPEDAIGAVIRGNRLVVVGDQMQLPPTDFFQRAEMDSVDEINEEEAAAIHGLESILDKAASVFQPARRLLWHYRSKDPRLIAYSNKEFYDNALQLFPAANFGDPKHGVKVVEVGGVYSGRCNVKEADSMAEAAVAFMRRYPNRSLGLVALNGQQRDLIQGKVDRLIAADRDATEYCRSFGSGLEPFFVKNLENVQGDERDVIFISTVFGRDSAGNSYQRFGPINSAVGHRRLNVLFTRAKEAVVVFTSLRTEDIHIDETCPRGRKVLHDYLEYARSGRLEAGVSTGNGTDSDFEDMVRRRLQLEGFEVDCQVGVAGYRVDLAVKHPQNPTSYVLAVECDGATYHSFKSARDRDRLRQEILERLGWKIHRIWSTDWFHNPEQEMQKLLARLNTEIQAAKPDKQEHLDFARFAVSANGISPPPSKMRPKNNEPVKLTTANAPTSRAPKFADGEIGQFLKQLKLRATDEIFCAFEQSIAFEKGAPIQIVIHSTRQGIQRKLELEEAYNREAFRWATSSGNPSLFRMPWATNLSNDENLQLREFALSTLIKSGKIR